MFSIRSRAFSCSILVAVLAHVAAATTYTVDATGGPGSQFTDIQAAVSIAAPGDSILVRAGTYSSFTVARGMNIRGISEFAIVNGTVVVAGIPAGERVVLGHLYPAQVTLDSCSGPIYAEVLSSTRVSIRNCLDVRFVSVFVVAPQGPAVCGLEVENSRVELLGGSIVGSSSPSAPAPFQNGGEALHATAQSRIHSIFTTFRGGNSAVNFTAASSSGSGGSGLILDGASSLRMHAGGVHVGVPGSCIAPQCVDCSFDGAMGAGIVLLQGSTVEYSSSTEFGSFLHHSPPSCNLVPVSAVVGPGAAVFSPHDPSLARGPSTTTPFGYRVNYSVHGTPGSTVMLWLGRALIVHPTPPIAVEQLISHDRGFSLGVIPSTQGVTLTLTIPYGLPPDFLFGAQAEVQLPTGEIRRTNSVETTISGL